MYMEYMYAKIHRATVTDANLEYVGSITVDENLMEAAHLQEWQKVEVLNINNGERFQTYVIKGKLGSGEICINGAAARKALVKDKVIIVAYASMTPEERQGFNPHIVFVDEKNKIVK